VKKKNAEEADRKGVAFEARSPHVNTRRSSTNRQQRQQERSLKGREYSGRANAVITEVF